MDSACAALQWPAIMPNARRWPNIIPSRRASCSACGISFGSFIKNPFRAAVGKCISQQVSTLSGNKEVAGGGLAGLGNPFPKSPLSPCHTGLSNQRRAPQARTSNRLFYSAIGVFKKKKCWRDWRRLAAQPKFHRARHQIRRVPLHPMAGGGNGDQREIFVQPLPRIVEWDRK